MTEKKKTKIGKFDVNRLSVYNRTPLHMAALCGRVNIIDYLINYLINIFLYIYYYNS